MPARFRYAMKVTPAMHRASPKGKGPKEMGIRYLHERRG